MATEAERLATIERVKQASADAHRRGGRAGAIASAAARANAAPPPAPKPKLVAYEKHAETLTALQVAEERCALRDAALTAARADAVALAALVFRIGGYMAPEDQQAVWAAEARLAEAGIVVARPVRRTR